MHRHGISRPDDAEALTVSREAAELPQTIIAHVCGPIEMAFFLQVPEVDGRSGLSGHQARAVPCHKGGVNAGPAHSLVHRNLSLPVPDSNQAIPYLPLSRFSLSRFSRGQQPL